MCEKIYYRSLNKYLKERFGCKVYKLSLNINVTCPNRDGTIDTRGCIFCSRGGSGDFSVKVERPLKEELSIAKELVKKKLPKNSPCKFIAYFQAFTNTYGEPSYLREKFLEAAYDEEICAISIATRPDCLPDEVMDILLEVNKVKPVWIELGLQTIHEKSAKYIRRGYELFVYDKAVEKLKSAGLEVITHVILGLPGESKEDMLSTVKYVCDSNVEGIKLQLLHVLKNTDLCKEYEAGRVKTLSFDEYLDIVCDCLRIIPKDIVVHRITGDGKRSELVAPLWSLDKKRVLNEFAKYITAEEK